MNPSSQISIVVAEDRAGERLDRFCTASVPGLSRTQVQALNAAGGVHVDERVRPDSYTLSAGELVAIDPAHGGIIGSSACMEPSARTMFR